MLCDHRDEDFARRAGGFRESPYGGRAMMRAFVDFCESRGASRITLDTDTESNYTFYEKFGFTVKGEFHSPPQKEYSGSSGLSFVYELRL